jgi:hypothetical protein
MSKLNDWLNLTEEQLEVILPKGTIPATARENYLDQGIPRDELRAQLVVRVMNSAPLMEHSMASDVVDEVILPLLENK